ncbi:DUF1205 domain-containing protein [Actinomadura sp. ATCC 31491]|uniref:DUF1205 domain-containing protein n=1 Tax=Actinomadura luzonensis TaxID=2805427 RepID=A0ABT0G902_9ACTN|nr:nucleotide disphospho-sugar-binding domain-containing protein [Actinomadura luzonensis]MCK2221072.1 DUF1205 domain-containing protein [Actinomadura luzonensis]
MRILFVTAALPSHYLGMVPLAWACHAAGHEVRVCAQPAVAPVVLASGLPAVTAGDDLDFVSMHQGKVAGRPDPGRQYRARTAVIDMFHDVAELMVDDVVAFARAWRPHLVVRDQVAFAASVAAQAVGAPLVRHTWGPDVYGTDKGVWLAHEMLGRLEPVYRRHGAPVPDRFESVVVDLSPPSLRLPSRERTIPVRYVPYNGPGAVPSWALTPGERPRVCVTWGTWTSDATDDDSMAHLPAVVGSLCDQGMEVVAVVTAADRARLAGSGPGVRVAESLPLHAVLPGCAAVVHHGGAGTMLTALCHGVPQVVLPQMFDQQLNARLLAGAGAAHTLANDAAHRAGEAVAGLLADASCLARTEQIRREIAEQPAPAQIVTALTGLAAATSREST